MIAWAALAIGLLVYTNVGYPLLVAVMARLFPNRRAATPPDRETLPLVSVILPVFNGARFLPKKIDSLLAQDYPSDRVEILILCDGCSDDSEQVARGLAASPAAGGRIRIFTAEVRRGKPAAINALGAEARGDLLLLNDVRQPLSPNTIRALARALDDDRTGCATGTLVLSGDAGSGVYWRFENWIRRQESRFRGVVGMTGAIAMMRRADLMTLPENVILDDVYMPMQLALRGLRVVLVTEAEAYDDAFEDDREFNRKVRTLAGNYQLLALMPALLVPFRNPIWFEMTSHKVMRLAGPWLMLLLALVSIAGAFSTGPSFTTGVMRALLLAQVGFYAAAAVGRRAGRLCGLARTFTVLNTAAVVGLFRFVTGRQGITW